MVLPSLASARSFGARLATILQPGELIRLEGDLGAGKSEIARAVIQARAESEIAVPSPTFTLVQTYELPGLTVVHADLYRLTEAEEIYELGLFDDPKAVLIVEWWERAERLLPEPGLTIVLIQGETDEARHVTLLGEEAQWAERLQGLLL